MKMPATRAQLRRWLSASLIVAIPALPGMAMAGWWDNNDEPEAEETGIVEMVDDGLVGQLHLVESVVNLNQNNLIDSYAEFLPTWTARIPPRMHDSQTVPVTT